MFTKLARFQTIKFQDRVARRPVVAAYCNDNRKVPRIVAMTRRAERPILICHWRPATENGRLECRWRIASVEGTGAETTELPDSRMDAPGSRHRLVRRSRSAYRVKG
jgi:hypothetical protein